MTNAADCRSEEQGFESPTSRHARRAGRRKLLHGIHAWFDSRTEFHTPVTQQAEQRVLTPTDAGSIPVRRSTTTDDDDHVTSADRRCQWENPIQKAYAPVAEHGIRGSLRNCYIEGSNPSGRTTTTDNVDQESNADRRCQRENLLTGNPTSLVNLA